MSTILIHVSPEWEVGSQPPLGYLAKSEWAMVQFPAASVRLSSAHSDESNQVTPTHGGTMKPIKGQSRSGDVLIHPVKEIPEGAVRVRREGRIVLAEGEVTGHAHVIDPETVELYEKDGTLYMKILAPSEVIHEEHAPAKVRPGIVERRFPFEWTDGDEPIQVQD